MTHLDNQQIYMTNLICETLPDSYLTDAYIKSIDLPSTGHFVVLQLILSNGFRQLISEIPKDQLSQWKIDFHHKINTHFSSSSLIPLALLNLEPFTRTIILNYTSSILDPLLLLNTFNSLCHHLTQDYNNSLIGCYSLSVHHLKDIGKAYKSAIKLQDYSYVIGLSKCLIYDKIQLTDDYSLIEYKFIDHYNKLFTKKDWIELYQLLDQIKDNAINSFMLNSKTMYLYKELFGITIRQLFEINHPNKTKFIEQLNRGINRFNYIYNDINEAHLALLTILNLITDHTISPIHPTIRKVLGHIETSYMEPLSLNYLCDLYKLSPSYLSRLFKDEVGSNFKIYLTSYRVKITKKLLKETSLSINIISQKVGYQSASQLVRVFKTREGMTPSAYRKIELDY